MRFTITRAGKRIAGLASHLASSRRPLPLSIGLLLAGQDQRECLRNDFAVGFGIAAQEHALLHGLAFGDARRRTEAQEGPRPYLPSTRLQRVPFRAGFFGENVFSDPFREAREDPFAASLR